MEHIFVKEGGLESLLNVSSLKLRVIDGFLDLVLRSNTRTIGSDLEQVAIIEGDERNESLFKIAFLSAKGPIHSKSETQMFCFKPSQS